MCDSLGPMTTQAANPYGVTLFSVNSPSGSELNLQTQEEAEWYESRRDRYLSDNMFTNVSDLQDLDRLLMLEVMLYRWGLWMGQGFDYLYSRIDENQLKNNLKDYSTEVRLIKASLGIDKVNRDKDKSESLSDYVDKLLERAKIFGYHRNQQYEMAVTKFYQLRSMVMTYERCDTEERELLDLSMESILDWVTAELIKPFDELQTPFRKAPAIWIREQ